MLTDWRVFGDVKLQHLIGNVGMIIVDVADFNDDFYGRRDWLRRRRVYANERQVEELMTLSIQSRAHVQTTRRRI